MSISACIPANSDEDYSSLWWVRKEPGSAYQCLRPLSTGSLGDCSRPPRQDGARTKSAHQATSERGGRRKEKAHVVWDLGETSREKQHSNKPWQRKHSGKERNGQTQPFEQMHRFGKAYGLGLNPVFVPWEFRCIVLILIKLYRLFLNGSSHSL